jgi:hypothetical protein
MQGTTFVGGIVPCLIERAAPAFFYIAMNYFYTDSNGHKRGPYTEQQLRRLVAKEVIAPTTPLETDTGQKRTAGQFL